MSRELDANIAFGFILDADTKVEDLPQEFIDIMESDDNPYYNSPDRAFDLNGAIRCTAQKRYGLIDTDFPGTGADSQIVVYIRNTMISATNEAVAFTMKKPAKSEEEAIASLAEAFGKKPQWIVYPTYI